MVNWIILSHSAAAAAFAVLSLNVNTAAVSWGRVIIIFRVICTFAEVVSSRWSTRVHMHVYHLYRHGNCVYLQPNYTSFNRLEVTFFRFLFFVQKSKKLLLRGNLSNGIKQQC